jgi:TonB family protein
VQLRTDKSVSGRRRHSRFSKWNVTVVLLAMLLPLRFAWADGVEGQLKSDYVDKVLTLRHFYGGEHLRFHADGTLQGDAEVGSWTVDAQIAVKEVRLRGGLLIVQGRRIYRVFDYQLKPQDELMTIDHNHDKPSKDAEKILRSLSVEIEIELPSEKPDQKDISSAIHGVFLTDSESMIDVVPSYWRAYFAGQEGKPQSATKSEEPIYRANPGSGVSLPHATYQPDPEYSEEARELKHQGTVLISLVVDASGTPIDLQIQRPTGLGLDEKAVAAASTWKFEPAQKDGKPVAVAISIEIQFNLY